MWRHHHRVFRGLHQGAETVLYQRSLHHGHCVVPAKFLQGNSRAICGLEHTVCELRPSLPGGGPRFWSRHMVFVVLLRELELQQSESFTVQPCPHDHYPWRWAPMHNDQCSVCSQSMVLM